MKTITYNLYTIDEHPNKEKVFKWIRSNWHDLNQHDVDEMIESLKSIAERLNSTLKYCISQVPDRGEYIRFITDESVDRSKTVNPDELAILYKQSEECNFTDGNYDYILSLAIDDFQEPTLNDLFEITASRALQLVHDQTEYVYSDEGLTEICQANDYHFYECGRVE